LEDFFGVIKSSLLQFTVWDIVDILLVAVIIYFLLKITSKTRAIQVLKGLGIIIVIARVCELLRLTAVVWLLDYVIGAGAVFLVILFHPEIRRALERIGRGKFFALSFTSSSTGDEEKIIEEIQRAVQNLSIHKTGALIVFERKTGLRDVTESGTYINADISSEMIENIFYVGAPLHDGAMIIKGSKIIAAGCFLPLSDNKQIASELGTRHRAALGISELSDSITVIVSEETGVISVANEGTLTRYMDSKALREVLEQIYSDKPNAVQTIGEKIKRKGSNK